MRKPHFNLMLGSVAAIGALAFTMPAAHAGTLYWRGAVDDTATITIHRQDVSIDADAAERVQVKIQNERDRKIFAPVARRIGRAKQGTEKVEHDELLDFDGITYHPKLDLFQTVLPTSFELAHPLAILDQIGKIDDDPHKIVAVDNSAVSPVPFHSLRLVTGRPEVIDDLQHSLGKPLRRYLATIVKSQR